MSALRLRFLPANQCWTFVFGASLVGMGDRLLFYTRADAVETARDCGLVVHRDGRTETMEVAQSEGGPS